MKGFRESTRILRDGLMAEESAGCCAP
jgi:hypothetical protein